MRTPEEICADIEDRLKDFFASYREVVSQEDDRAREQRRLSELDRHALAEDLLKRRGTDLERQVAKLTRELAESREALREREEQFRKIFDEGPLAMAIVGLDTRLQRVNGMLCRLTGYSESELLGRSFADITHPDDVGLDLELAREVFAGEIPFYRLRKRYIRKDGSVVWGALTASVVRNADRSAAFGLGMVEEIDPRTPLAPKHAAPGGERRESRTVEGLEGLGTLAGGIAHALNNLLQPIIGYADMLRPDVSGNSQALAHLHNIDTAAKDAAALCGQMLAYAGKSRFVARSVNLNDLIADIRATLRTRATDRVTPVFDLAAQLPAVSGDETHLRQMLVNLLTNAAEAIGQGTGTVTVRTRLQSLGPDRDAVSGTASQVVCIEVSDTGCGIDEAIKPRIFEPFFSTKFQRGLGLSAVWGIVRAHGGTIDVENAPEKGTTVRVTLPATVEADGPIPPASKTSGRAWRGSGMILLVDDDDPVRRVTRKMLESLGFSVIEAREGREALERFRRQSREIACVVLDVTMPVKDGQQTLRELRALQPDVKVLMISGFTLDWMREARDVVGPDLFLEKPFRIETLRQVLRRLLEEGEQAAE